MWCTKSYNACRPCVGPPCSLLLLFWCLTLPVIVAVYVDFVWLGAAISFLGVLSLFSINGVSSELECPFDDTANDLSLEYFKDEFTDSMAEMMAWLAEKSNGNVAGSLEAKPAEEPWGLIKAQIAMREKHGGKLMETESPLGTEDEVHNYIPAEVRMRVTKSRFSGATTVVSTLDKYRTQKGIFWLH